jgi:hypothetical protein
MESDIAVEIFITSQFKIVTMKTTGILIITIAVVFIIVILATFFFLMRLSLFIFPASQGTDIKKTSLASWPLISQGGMSKQPVFSQILMNINIEMFYGYLRK